MTGGNLLGNHGDDGGDGGDENGGEVDSVGNDGIGWRSTSICTFSPSTTSYLTSVLSNSGGSAG